MLQKIKKSIAYINRKVAGDSTIGIILGSGSGDFGKDMLVKCRLSYNKIPYFPATGIDGHEGNLLISEFMGKSVVIMQGRIHYYEGYTMEEVTYPVRVMKYLGVKKLLLSNASGGLNPSFKVGDLMLITDHINLMPNPLIGKHYPEFGQRFPDMSEAYDKNLMTEAESAAAELKISIKKGCYIGVTGPTYETPSEYEYLRRIGGDAVGMSTVPEVIVARQMGIACLGISIIADLGFPDSIQHLTHAIVKAEAEKAIPELAAIFKKVVSAC